MWNKNTIDECPKNIETVLVCTERGFYEIAEYVGALCFLSCHTGNVLSVKYWMSIPKTPKDEVFAEKRK